MLVGLVVAVSWLSTPRSGDLASAAKSPGAAPSQPDRVVRGMAVDPNRIAVLLSSGGSGQAVLEQWLARHAPGAQLDLAWHGDQWALIDMQDSSRRAAAWDDVLRSGQSLPGTDYVAPVFVDALGGPLVPGPSVLVGFDPGLSQRAIGRLLADAGIARESISADIGHLRNVHQVFVNTGSGWDVLSLAATLQAGPGVRYAEPDWIFTGRRDLIEPNDPLYDACWGLHNTAQDGACQSGPGVNDVDIDAPEAWDFTIGADDVIIVVIDDGVQLDHPDLNTGEQYGEDFTGDLPAGVSPGWPVDPCDQHGTAVAGVIAAKLDNAMGGVGRSSGCGGGLGPGSSVTGNM